MIKRIANLATRQSRSLTTKTPVAMSAPKAAAGHDSHGHDDHHDAHAPHPVSKV